MHRDVSATGPRPPQEVWERYATPARWAGWSPTIGAVRYPHARLAAGTSGAVRPVIGPWLPFEVTAVDEAARTWRWVVDLRVARVVMDHDVLAGPRGGTVAVVGLDGPAPVVLAYAPVVALALGRMLAV